MPDYSNDATINGDPAIGGTPTKRQNLPLDQHGNVDWKKLHEIQLHGYSTAELEAELARRAEDTDA